MDDRVEAAVTLHRLRLRGRGGRCGLALLPLAGLRSRALFLPGPLLGLARFPLLLRGALAIGGASLALACPRLHLGLAPLHVTGLLVRLRLGLGRLLRGLGLGLATFLRFLLGPARLGASRALAGGSLRRGRGGRGGGSDRRARGWDGASLGGRLGRGRRNRCLRRRRGRRRRRLCSRSVRLRSLGGGVGHVGSGRRLLRPSRFLLVPPLQPERTHRGLSSHMCRVPGQRIRLRSSRSTSRLTSRSRISRRRSRPSLPRASAISTFARGPLK